MRPLINQGERDELRGRYACEQRDRTDRGKHHAPSLAA
jgi:hypothetical protein